MWFLAQRGTGVALVQAETPREAGPALAEALRLDRCAPRRWFAPKWDERAERMIRALTGPEDGSRQPPGREWPRDWRGVRLRPASADEAAAFHDAHAQDRSLPSRRAVREAITTGAP